MGFVNLWYWWRRYRETGNLIYLMFVIFGIVLFIAFVIVFLVVWSK